MTRRGFQAARATLAQSKAASTRQIRGVAHKRQRRVKVNRTLAQKASEHEAKKACTLEYSNALENARSVIFQQAELMHETFQNHSAEYYFEQIMQFARKTKARKRINRWNAFTRLEANKAAQLGVYITHWQ